MTVLRYLQPRIKGMSNGLFANWMPTNHVEIGDYGVVRNGQFERMGSIRDYGADFNVEDMPLAKGDIAYKDRFEIKVAGHASGHVPGHSARISLKAGGRGSFVYHLSNARQRRPESTRGFNEEVARTLLGSKIDFPKDGVLITELQIADKATIIVSDRDEGSLELETSFKPTGDAFLSGADGKLSTVTSMGSFLQWLGKDKTTALIKIVIPKVTPRGGPGDGHGLFASTVEKVRDWIQEKRVGASQLRISYQDSDTPRTVISVPGDPRMITLELEDMSAEELLDTILQEPETVRAADDDAAAFTMEIDEEDFGESQERTAYG